MQAADNEKRRHVRIDITWPLKVIDTMSNESLGLMVNVSRDGMMLIGEKVVVDGAVYQVELHFGGDQDSLKLGIECLWSSEADSEDKSWSGYRIIDMRQEDSGLLNALIDQI